MDTPHKPPDPLLAVSEETAYTIAMSMYLGEKCKYCGKEYKYLCDLDDVVWAGYHEHGRLACGACWRRRRPEMG